MEILPSLKQTYRKRKQNNDQTQTLTSNRPAGSSLPTPGATYPPLLIRFHFNSGDESGNALQKLHGKMAGGAHLAGEGSCIGRGAGRMVVVCRNDSQAPGVQVPATNSPNAKQLTSLSPLQCPELCNRINDED